MKLKNKKTGEIVYATMMASYGGGELQFRYYPVNNAESTHFKEYRSISELNAEWQDYEEPKTFWAISWTGEPEEYDAKNAPQELKDMARSIGDYFETKEEAEKAVEKLKAFKRLKDKGFRFTGYTHKDRGRLDELEIYCQLGECPENIEEMDDVHLLFGVEE